MQSTSYEQNIKTMFANIWTWFKAQHLWVQLIIAGALIGLASPWLLIIFALVVVVAIFKSSK